MSGRGSARPPHVAAAAIAPALFFLVALSPVELLGCRLRGLIAVGIALISVLLALAAAVLALRDRARGGRDGEPWVLVSIVLALPAVGLLVLA